MTVVLVLGGLAVGSCARKRATAPPAAARAAVEWAGCAAVSKGPRCRLSPARRLTIWTAREDAAQWTLAADGRAFPRAAAEPMQDGWRIAFDVPVGAHEVAAVAPNDGGAVWTLALDTSTAPPSLEALVAAGKRGDAGAEAQLRKLATSGAPAERGPAQAGLGRVLLARGQMDLAEAPLRAAVAADKAEGRVSDEIRDGAALMWGLVVLQQRFADARAVLESLASARDQFSEGAIRYTYCEGLLSAETDDLRSALASYRAVVHRARRLSMDALANSADEDLARILVVLGRAAEAAAVLDRLPSKADPCAQASLTINRVEALTEAAASDRLSDTSPVDDARVKVALAEEQRATAACPDPHRRLLAGVDAARHALATGDAVTADALVAGLRADAGAQDALAQAWRADVIGRWALERGDAARALTSFDAEASIAGAAGLRDERFDAEVGGGEALLALGRRPLGIARLEAAQALMERTLDGIPLTEGRGAFLGSHDEAARHLVDALVDGGAVAEAMRVARVVRTMEVAHAARLDRLRRLSPEQRRQWDAALERYAGIRRGIEREATEDWTLPATALARVRADREIRASSARDVLDAAYRVLVDLPAPARPASAAPRPGEVEILFFESAKGWFAFTRTAKGVHARRFREQALDSNRSASAILEQLSPELEGARRALVMASGRADRIDWHALPWRGAPLVARMQVAYSLDLPGAQERASRDDGAATRALLVADPTGDLAATTKEGDFVARALDGWHLTRLDGRAATRDALLAVLPEVALFHYAGHAAVGGAGGAASALVLASGAHIELGDLLALPRLPDVVVLSACRAADATSMMGLAQAFLVAGTRAVVAPIRDVDDAQAQSFMVSLYEALRARGLPTLEPAFQRAAREAVGKDAQSFRLVVQDWGISNAQSVKGTGGHHERD